MSRKIKAFQCNLIVKEVLINIRHAAQLVVKWKHKSQSLYTHPVPVYRGKAQINQKLTMAINLGLSNSGQLGCRTTLVVYVQYDESKKLAGFVRTEIQSLLAQGQKEQLRLGLQECADDAAAITFSIEAKEIDPFQQSFHSQQSSISYQYFQEERQVLIQQPLHLNSLTALHSSHSPLYTPRFDIRAVQHHHKTFAHSTQHHKRNSQRNLQREARVQESNRLKQKILQLQREQESFQRNRLESKERQSSLGQELEKVRSQNSILQKKLELKEKSGQRQLLEQQQKNLLLTNDIKQLQQRIRCLQPQLNKLRQEGKVRLLQLQTLKESALGKDQQIINLQRVVKQVKFQNGDKDQQIGRLKKQVMVLLASKKKLQFQYSRFEIQGVRQKDPVRGERADDQLKVRRLRQQKQSLEKELQESSRLINSLKKQVSNFQEDKSKTQEHQLKRIKELEEKLRDQSNRNQAKIQQKERTVRQLQRRLSKSEQETSEARESENERKKQIQKKMKQVNQLKESHLILNNQFQNLKVSFSQRQNQIQIVKKNNAALKNQLNSSRGQTDAQVRLLSQLKRDFQNQISNLKRNHSKDVQQLQNQNKRLQEVRQSLLKKLDQLTIEAQAGLKHKDNKFSQLEQLKVQINSLEKLKLQQDKQIMHHKDNQRQFKKQVETLRAQLDLSKDQLKRIRQDQTKSKIYGDRTPDHQGCQQRIAQLIEANRKLEQRLQASRIEPGKRGNILQQTSQDHRQQQTKKIITELKFKLNQYNMQLDQQRKMNFQLRKQLQEARKTVGVSPAVLPSPSYPPFPQTDLRGELDSLKRQLQDRKRLLEKVQSSLSQKESDLKKLSDQNRQLKDRLSEMKSDAKSTAKQNDSLIKQLQRQIKRLQERKNEEVFRPSRYQSQKISDSHLLQSKLQALKIQVDDLKDKNRQFKLKFEKEKSLNQSLQKQLSSIKLKASYQKPQLPLEAVLSKFKDMFQSKAESHPSSEHLKFRIQSLQSKLAQKQRNEGLRREQIQNIQRERKKVQQRLVQIREQSMNSKFSYDRENQRLKFSMGQIQKKYQNLTRNHQELLLQNNKLKAINKEHQQNYSQLKSLEKQATRVAISLQKEKRQKNQLVSKNSELQKELVLLNQKLAAEQRKNSINMQRMQGQLQKQADQLGKQIQISNRNSLRVTSEISELRAVRELQVRKQKQMQNELNDKNRQINILKGQTLKLQNHHPQQFKVQAKIKDKQIQTHKQNLEKAFTEIHNFRLKHRQLELQLKFKEQNLTASLNKLTQQLKGVTQQRNVARESEQQLSLKLKLKESQSDKTQQQIRRIKGQNAQLVQAINKLRQELMNSRLKIQTVQNKTESLQQRVSADLSLRQDLSKLRKELNQTLLQRQQQRRTNQTLRKQSESYAQSIQSLKRQLNCLQLSNEKQMKQKQSISKDLQTVNIQIQRVRSALNRKQKQFQSQKVSIFELQILRDNLSNENSNFKRQLKDKNQNIENLRVQLEKGLNQIQMQRKQLKGLQLLPAQAAKIQQIQRRLRDKQIQIEKSNHQNRQQKRNVEQLNFRIQSLTQQASKHQTAFKELQQQKRNNQKRLKEQIQSLSFRQKKQKQKKQQRHRQPIRRQQDAERSDGDREKLFAIMNQNQVLRQKLVQTKALNQTIYQLRQQNMRLKKSQTGMSKPTQIRSQLTERINALQRQLIGRSKVIEQMNMQKERLKFQQKQRQLTLQRQKRVITQPLQKQIMRLNQQISQFKRRDQQNTKNVEVFNKQKAKLQKQLISLSQEKKRLQVCMGQVQSQTQQLSANRLMLQSRLNEQIFKNNQLVSVQESLYSKNNEFQQLLKRYQLARQQLQFMLSKEPEIHSLLIQFQTKYQQQSHVIRLLQQRLRQCLCREQQGCNTLQTLRMNNDDLNSQVVQLTNKCSFLQFELKSKQSSSEQMKVKERDLKSRLVQLQACYRNERQSLNKRSGSQESLLSQVRVLRDELQQYRKNYVPKSSYQNIVLNLQKQNSIYELQAKKRTSGDHDNFRVRTQLQKLSGQLNSRNNLYLQLLQELQLFSQKIRNKTFDNTPYKNQELNQLHNYFKQLFTHPKCKQLENQLFQLLQTSHIQQAFWKIRELQQDNHSLSEQVTRMHCLLQQKTQCLKRTYSLQQIIFDLQQREIKLMQQLRKAQSLKI